jgi:small subunit ribosomal protein S14
MARESQLVKQTLKPKHKVQFRHRCKICGRPRGYMRKFGICRICFRELVNKGEIPGIRKASW